MIKAKALLIYYLILSFVFFGGRIYIMEANHMKQGPVPLEAFHKLMEWVNLFSFFYIVPLLVAGLLEFIRFARQRKLSLFLINLLSILYMALAGVVGICLKFIFILLFYGFAP